MAWVKAEYAPELAVLSAWLSALLPWSFTLQPDGPIGTIMLFVRWPIGEVQVRIPPTVTVGNESLPIDRVLDAAYPGTHIWGPFYVADPLSATATYGSAWVATGGIAWLIGTIAVFTGVVVSLALYQDESATTARLPVDPIRAMAGLFALATVAFAVATFGLWQGPPRLGLAVPAGVLILGAFAVVLGRVKRV